jgi:cytochrome c oxidase assembly protein subunit 15
VNGAGQIFTQHRDTALLVLFINVMLYALIRRHFSRHSIQQQLMSLSFLIIMLQIVTGIILSYLSLPPFAQTAHITLASLMFGAQFYLMLNLYKSASRQGVSK